ARLRLVIEEPQRRELHEIRLRPAPQVQPKRRGNGQRAQQSQRIKERKRHSPPLHGFGTFATKERNPSNCISPSHWRISQLWFKPRPRRADIGRSMRTKSV